MSLLKDREGVVWVGSHRGLCRLVAQPSFDRSIVARLYTTKDGLPADWIRALFQSSGGRLWVATDAGLSEFVPTADQNLPQFRAYRKAQGLSDEQIYTLAEDRDGNLWAGTESGGAMKIARNGFVTYREADGLAGPRIGVILENKAGEICVFGGAASLFADYFDGTRFRTVKINLPAGTVFSWGWYQTVLQDHLGEWWIATAEGVFRFPRVSAIEKLASVRPKLTYTTEDGLSGNEIFRMFEDSRGDVWIGNTTEGGKFLDRWERATGSFQLQVHSKSEAVAKALRHGLTR